MQTPDNAFKQALAQGTPQIGLWVGLADAYVTEVVAGVGYDWLLLDGEHAPNDVRSILAQLQAVSSAWSASSHRSHPVVRIPVGDSTLVKQYLDLGAQTLLVPMVDTAEQAEHLVRAMRYPPAGFRGMGSALARASRWQAYPRYIHEANERACLLVQVETVTALANLDEILAVDGVDGVFIGPADLSASMGHVGEPGHADVQSAIANAIVRIRKAGKGAGILATTDEQARKWLAAGATFVAVGVDTIVLAAAARELLGRFKTLKVAGPNGY